MKKLNYFLMSLIIFSSMVFYSCHTETPVNIDHESPEITIQMIYNSTDTLYNSTDTTTTFIDFDQIIVDGDHFIELSATDNGNLYKVSSFAEDSISGESYLIESKILNSKEDLTFTVSRADIPTVQDIDPQKFYLYFTVSDDTENFTKSSVLGFNIMKLYIQEKLYNEFGLLRETNETTADRDFRDKVGELTFIQFMAYG